MQNPFRTEHSLARWKSYPHEVHTINLTGNLVRPHLIDPIVYGWHISFVEDGLRKWRFENRAGFLRFCADYIDRIEYHSPSEI